jgi:molybdopterin-guanine dinucleotide biosynthesis protein A
LIFQARAFIVRLVWTGLVFAGGLSRRMGTDKALLEVGGRTLLLRAIDAVREAGGEPIVLGPPRPKDAVGGARQADETEGGGEPAGPLPALRRGLSLSRAGQPALALACDVPLVPAAFLRFLIDSAPGWDAVVPRVAGESQVLTAAYDPTACLPVLDRALERGTRAVHAVLDDLRVRFVDEVAVAPFGGAAIFLNVNTPAERERAEAALMERAR